MQDTILSLVKERCSSKGISSRSIILHGSQAVGFANEYSDYDILVVSDNRSKDRIDAFITEDDRRIQIEFMEGNELKHALDSYESLLFKQILDLNIMAGRILEGQILEADSEYREIIDSHHQYRNQDALIKRFLYTATNSFNDSKSDDCLLKKHSYLSAALNIGTAMLIKNNVFWLHIKWQHRYLERILSEDDYARYLTIRWPRDLTEEQFLSISKKLIKEYIYR